MKNKNNKFKTLIKGFFIIPLLFSCSSYTTHSAIEYKKSLPFVDNFKIMQLTDIHLSQFSNLTYQFAYLEKNIVESEPNLIILTGDTFYDANANIIDAFFKFVDKFNIPFAFTYGNHDDSSSISIYEISRSILKTKNSVFVSYENDILKGKTNYYINLMNGDDLLYKLYILGSNTYTFVNGTYCYDTYSDGQLNNMMAINNLESDTDFISLVFTHYPTAEYKDAQDSYVKNESIGFGINYSNYFGYKYKNNEMTKKVFDDIGVKGIFCGHKHTNCASIKYGDIVYSYGVKSSDLLYHRNDMIGYKEIVLSSTLDFGLENITNVYRKY